MDIFYSWKNKKFYFWKNRKITLSKGWKYSSLERLAKSHSVNEWQLTNLKMMEKFNSQNNGYILEWIRNSILEKIDKLHLWKVMVFGHSVLCG